MQHGKFLLQFRGNTQGANNGLVGVLTNDFIVRLPSATSLFKFQNSATSDMCTWNSNTNGWDFGTDDVVVDTFTVNNDSYLYKTCTMNNTGNVKTLIVNQDST